MSTADDHHAGHDHGSNVIALRTRGLVVGHRGKALLPPLDLELARGHLLLVLGRNGSGKTTLVRTLLGLLPPVAGKVEWTPDTRRAYVPQAGALDTAVPVRARDVVAWGGLRGWDFLRPWRRTPPATVRDALGALDVLPLGGRPLRELSGGQVQRVLFARVLASHADIAVLDEPTAAMDAAGERAVYRTLSRLAHERGFAIVVVTHAVTAALGSCDQILLLDPDGSEKPQVVLGRADEVTRSAAYRRIFSPDGADAA
jgi:zinc transport system ATP-binding protein